MIHYSGTVETNQHTNEASQDRKSPPTFKINVNRFKSGARPRVRPMLISDSVCLSLNMLQYLCLSIKEEIRECDQAFSNQTIYPRDGKFLLQQPY